MKRSEERGYSSEDRKRGGGGRRRGRGKPGRVVRGKKEEEE